MFKEGDKIICIDDYNQASHTGDWDKSYRGLKKYETYTVIKNNSTKDWGVPCVILEGDDTIWYAMDRFIPFSEFRKMKINKLIYNKWE